MAITIYLAGGMKSDWQNIVQTNCGSEKTIFINPQNHGLGTPEQYTFWDLFGVKNCDILFGFMEENNPSGFGLAAEIGYAKALGKLVIIVDEKSPKDIRFKNMYAMINQMADVRFDTLALGMDYLNRFTK